MIKRLLITLLLVGNANAAPDFAAFEQFRDQLRAKKEGIMMDSMQLTAADQEKFTPIYREYNTKIMAIRDQRLELVKEFSSKYSEMDDKRAASLSKEIFKLMSDRNKLREQYHGKVSKALSPVHAIRFVQVDAQMDTLLNVIRVRNIPLMKTPDEVTNDFGISVTAGVIDDADKKINDNMALPE